MDNCRHAFRALRDDAEKFRNISAWASCTVDRTEFFVVILTETQERLDSAAEIVFSQHGAIGNYLMSAEMMEAFANRRYGALSERLKEQLASGEPLRQIRQDATYGSGVYMGLDGQPRDRSAT
jgi:hypothetical protein